MFLRLLYITHIPENFENDFKCFNLVIFQDNSIYEPFQAKVDSGISK
jgi:hypothetical protein